MEKTLRYAASGYGLALTGLVVAFAVGEGMPNPFSQPLPVRLDFAALGLAMTGALVALKWGRVGGALMVFGSFMFDGVEWFAHHRHFPFILVFALVGLLHVLASVAKTPESRPGKNVPA